MKLIRPILSLALATVFAASVASAQTAPASLTLTGEDGTSKTLTLAELAKLPQSEVVTLTRDSAKIVFRGPTLRSLVTMVGAPTGRALRGPNMMLAIVADCADGYRAGFMLAEVDEQFGNRLAILALSQNGAAIDAEDGPFRLVVSGEEHRARWARQVTRLRIVRVGS